MKKIKEAGKEENIKLDLEKYSKHSEIATYYPPLLEKCVIDTFPELKEYLFIRDVLVTKTDNLFKLNVKHYNGVKFAWYVYLNNERVFVQPYTSEEYFEYRAEKAGEYKFRAFVCDAINNKIAKSSKSFYVDNVEVKENQ